MSDLLLIVTVGALLWAAVSPLGGWALMLLLGVLHGDFHETAPTPGYWPCVAVVLLLGLVYKTVTARSGS